MNDGSPGETGRPRLPAALRLPLDFEIGPLAAEVARIAPEAWVAHFNTGYHDGGWNGLALRSQGGRAERLYLDPSSSEPAADTELLERSPALSAALARFACPVRAARLLRLAPGAVIREHRDYGLGYEEGEARLHVPIVTSPLVEFFVDGDRVEMREGECWYLDASRPHKVANRGASPRVHLVVDCQVEAWLERLVARALEAVPERAELASVARRGGLAEFRDEVLADHALAARLREVEDVEAFLALAVRLGRERGFEFTVEEAAEEFRARRCEAFSAWIE